MRALRFIIPVLALSLSALTSASANSQFSNDAQRFRDIFLGAAGHMNGDAAKLLVYQPTPSLLQEPAGARTAEEFFTALGTQARDARAIALYDQAYWTPMNPMPGADIEKAIRQFSPAGNLATIVLVPGVFGETIATHAFEEVFQDRSEYRELWQASVRELRAKNPADSRLSDRQYSLMKLAELDAPIESLFQVSTLRAADGSALANVMLFNTRMMSLESMGDIREKAALFLRRMRKFFDVMGTPSNLVFVGYSRGASVGLEMLAQAQRDPRTEAWLPRVRAMVSLGGVLYGSDIADVAMSASNAPLARKVALLQKLRDQLQETKSLADVPWSERWAVLRQNTATVEANTQAWVEFLSGMAQLEGVASTGELLAQVEKFRQSIAQQAMVDLHSFVELAAGIGLDAFQIHRPVTGYDLNIRRFKKLVDEALLAVRQLSTRERLDWWRHAALPTAGIRFYAITGVMADPETPDARERVLATNSVCFNPRLPDFSSLARSFRDFRDLTALPGNDSQVAIHKARFWNTATSLLNPKQPALDSRFLGVLGVHHWGLALRVVTETRDGELDPYPRKALLKALIGTVALDAQ